MDVLDKYKEVWGNQPEEVKKVSKVDIYRMMKSKSSSIVRWIFIIGVLEFIILSSSYLFFDFEKSNSVYESLGIKNFMIYSQVILFIIIIYFLCKFYINYKNISVTQTTKNLMTQILTTRNTVRNYILVNLSYLVIIVFVVTIAVLQQRYNHVSASKIIGIIIGILILMLILLIISWLFYQLLYGILLNKLYKNYKDLAKL